MLVGMTCVFVPQDLRYIGLAASDLTSINPRLIPLIAHDRAGFGGGLFSCGLMIALIMWKAPHIDRALWQALLIAGTAGFACALGIHFMIGYTDASHLGPAFAGFALFLTGLGLYEGRASPFMNQVRF